MGARGLPLETLGSAKMRLSTGAGGIRASVGWWTWAGCAACGGICWEHFIQDVMAGEIIQTEHGALYECWDWERVKVFPHGACAFLESGRLRGIRFEPVEFFRRGWGLGLDNRNEWSGLFDFLAVGGGSFRVDVPDWPEVVAALRADLPAIESDYSDVMVRWTGRGGVDLDAAAVLGNGLSAGRVTSSGMHAFAEIYLRCFEAEPRDWVAARENVMAIRQIPGWEGWMVSKDGVPVAGFGLFIRDGVAFLSSAATLPEHRRLGIQRSLIARRLLRALELGAERIVTYAHREGTSLKNLLSLGFEAESIRHTFRHPGTTQGNR